MTELYVELTDIKIEKVTCYYDIPWSGICSYKNKYYNFIVYDLTDYETMNNECPGCSSDNIDDLFLCNCIPFQRLSVELVPLTWYNHIKFKIEKMIC